MQRSAFQGVGKNSLLRIWYQDTHFSHSTSEHHIIMIIRRHIHFIGWICLEKMTESTISYIPEKNRSTKTFKVRKQNRGKRRNQARSGGNLEWSLNWLKIKVADRTLKTHIPTSLFLFSITCIVGIRLNWIHSHLDLTYSYVVRLVISSSARGCALVWWTRHTRCRLR